MATATRAVVAHGIEPGDRVAVWAPNCAEWVVAALGAVGAGAVLVPLNTRYKGAEAAYILRASGARILFTVQGFLGTDYPALLDEAVAAGEALPDLERVVVLRTDGAGRRAADGGRRSGRRLGGLPGRGRRLRARRGRRPHRGDHARTTCPTWSSPRGPPGTPRGR